MSLLFPQAIWSAVDNHFNLWSLFNVWNRWFVSFYFSFLGMYVSQNLWIPRGKTLSFHCGLFFIDCQSDRQITALCLICFTPHPRSLSFCTWACKTSQMMKDEIEKPKWILPYLPQVKFRHSQPLERISGAHVTAWQLAWLLKKKRHVPSGAANAQHGQF